MPTSRALLAAVLFVCMALPAIATAASAGPPRVIVLQPEDELLRALSLALSPWGVETARSDAPPPRASQPEAVEGASLLARSSGAAAVIWVSSTTHGSLVWVFDARTGEIATRMLEQRRPLDGPAAAAVALSVKTVLRSSVIAPPAERFGAQPSPLGEVQPTSLDEARRSALELGLGGQFAGEGELGLRGELVGLLWLSAARRFGLSLELSSGPGLRVDDAAFEGRYDEVVAGAKAHLRLLRSSSFSFVASVGGAAHWTKLSGVLVDSSIERKVSRVGPSFDVETSASVELGGGMYVGASLGALYSVHSRRYLVEGRPVFSPWRLGANFTGFCGVELF